MSMDLSIILFYHWSKWMPRLIFYSPYDRIMSFSIIQINLVDHMIITYICVRIYAISKKKKPWEVNCSHKYVAKKELR